MLFQEFRKRGNALHEAIGILFFSKESQWNSDGDCIWEDKKSQDPTPSILKGVPEIL